MTKDIGNPIIYSLGGHTVYSAWIDGQGAWYGFAGDDEACGPYATLTEALEAARAEFARRND